MRAESGARSHVGILAKRGGGGGGGATAGWTQVAKLAAAARQGIGARGRWAGCCKGRFSLQANAKTREGAQHPDRDAQFRYINDRAGAPRRGSR